jgi:peptidyl-prolyl cis-trans isomerase D
VLDNIRKGRNSLIVLLIFGAIILVFVFWGVGPSGNGGGDADAIATIDGEKITVREYLNTYKNEYEYFKKTFQGQFDDRAAERMNLKQRALDIVINRSLIGREAEDAGVRVTQEEVQSAIMAIPAFQRDGVFSKEHYFEVLQANRLKPADFEESLELDLMTAKMRNRAIQGISVTDDEIRAAYLAENRKIALDFIKVPSSKYLEAVEITPEEGRTFLEMNPDNFLEPTRFRALYAHVDLAEIAAGTKPSREEIKSYYEASQAQFETPAKVKASHILIKPKGPSGDREAAQKEAEALLERIKVGEDFVALATKHSDDPGSARKGGSLGWFAPGMMVKQFEEAAFALAPNEVSGVVETGFGFHIIKVVDRLEPGVEPLDAVSSDIEKILAWQSAQVEAEALLRELEGPLRAARTTEDLEKAVSDRRVKVVDTGMIEEADKKTPLLQNEKLENAVFTMSPDDISSPVEAADSLYLIKLIDRISSHVPPYNTIAESVNTRLRHRKAAEMALSLASELIDRGRAGEEFSTLADTEGVETGATGLFSRVDTFLPETTVFVADRPGLFTLTDAEPYFSEVLSSDEASYVLRMTSAEEANLSGLDEVKDQLSTRLLAEKQDEAIGTRCTRSVLKLPTAGPQTPPKNL